MEILYAIGISGLFEPAWISFIMDITAIDVIMLFDLMKNFY